jgi:hypothetical protein
VLKLAEERDRVAALAAPEAIEDLLARRDAERPGLLLVERTQARERVVAGLLEREVLADELDDVGPFLDGFDVFLADARHVSPGYRSQPWGRKSCS